ncbi:hypothetical protein ACFRMQ_04300 [Kitasatospora sp. NPDC056783]|uniref:hypothetical protein n=1 Tax=Kitasatospora sp. NPDC056783 TaxID=3345943 RepID=UPI003689F89A
MRVAVLYGFHASGHLVACERIAATVGARGHDVRLVSPLDSPELRDSIGSVFRAFAARSHPAVPAVLTGPSFLEDLYRQVDTTLHELLSDVDVVISTHPYSTWLSGRHAEVRALDYRLIDVQTDYGHWPVLPHHVVDAYVGPKLLFHREVNPRAHDIGIPPPPERASEAAFADGRREFMTKRPLLLLGGADGFAPLTETVRALASQDLPVLVVAGRNEALRRELEGRHAEPIRRGRIMVAGFVPDLWAVMPSASAVITKASGMTLIDAFAGRAPVICPPPILAWEAEGMSLLESAGAIHAVWNAEDFDPTAVRALVDDHERTDRQCELASAMVNDRYGDDLMDLVESRPARSFRHPPDVLRAIADDLRADRTLARLHRTAAGHRIATEIESYE